MNATGDGSAQRGITTARREGWWLHRRRAACVGALVFLGAHAGVASAQTGQSQQPVSPGSVAPATLQPGTMAARLAACTACHGESGSGSADGYFPRIAGKPPDYLYNQLVNFRDGRRRYLPMQRLLEYQSDAYLMEMAQWFSRETPAYPRIATQQGSAQRQRGEQLVRQGDAARNIPACTACHGAAMTGVLPASPGLLGLPHDYIASQFGAWRTGMRQAAAPDCMAEVAKRLTPEDVAAVAAWLSSQPVSQAGPPEPAVTGPLPMRCGSQPYTGKEAP